MPFESLSHRYTFSLANFPDRWLPLLQLYDPDLPLFPVLYFHVISPHAGARPLDTERAYGYVEALNVGEHGGVEAQIVTNKNFAHPTNASLKALVQSEVAERLGIANRVTEADVVNVFSGALRTANPVLYEMWQRVVANAYGNALPFGRLWDGVFGLARWVASFYSQAGRKGELIQTHFFASRLGVRIQSAASIPQRDFFLLPTLRELTDLTDPLAAFPEFAAAAAASREFTTAYCENVDISGVRFSKFNRPSKGKLNQSIILEIINGTISPAHRRAALECFNAFGKGPHRTIIFWMMLDDLRNGRVAPAALTPTQCGAIYDGLSRARTYQSAKVIQIYAQQCFGNVAAMPIDTWISSFFEFPLAVYPQRRGRTPHQDIFSQSNNLGKVERLLWVTAQARKVHSSACNNAVWCIKKGAVKGKPRGANPLACKICFAPIRNACPSYATIKTRKVAFNCGSAPAGGFVIRTSAGNSTTPGQRFVSCRGTSIYRPITDASSPTDDPSGFAPFPAAEQTRGSISVEEFVLRY